MPAMLHVESPLATDPSVLACVCVCVCVQSWLPEGVTFRPAINKSSSIDATRRSVDTMGMSQDGSVMSSEFGGVRSSVVDRLYGTFEKVRHTYTHTQTDTCALLVSIVDRRVPLHARTHSGTCKRLFLSLTHTHIYRHIHGHYVCACMCVCVTLDQGQD